MPRSLGVALALLAPLAALACGEGGADEPGVVRVSTSFDEDRDRWEAGFSDYGTAHEPMEVDAAMAELPPSVERQGRALRVSGRNTSDDLFMFLTRPVGEREGVVAGVAYEVEVTVELASDAPSGCAGIGGPPGESVYLKAGAAPVRPEPVLEDGTYRMNVDKGNQSTGGEAAAVIGDVANGIPCEEALAEDPPPFAVLEHRGGPEGAVRAGDDATLWLLVGTDSGFEGTTTLYYTSIEAVLRPVQG